MKPTVTRGIVLARTNYQEADRILTLLTPDHGKVRVLAKGVRKAKSKLAGGVELFSISEIGFIRGRGELATLISARLIRYFDTIVQDIDRTMLGYELLKLLNKVTEDAPGPEYLELLIETFEALDEPKLNIELIRLWFYAQLLRLAGHTPNLRRTSAGNPLEADAAYAFDFDDMAFTPHAEGPFSPHHIKFLRLTFSGNKPAVLQQVQGADKLILSCLTLAQTMLPNHIRT
ncbi:MAG TPA: DNA repair protein RecO [Candidatus Saccharimonadales bacterium]|nr:DNA repair protein RecO [Candidatus Saccharimonadales bacterium]